MHVSDVVAATLAALEAPQAPGHAINVATGQQVRVIDLARRLAAILAPEIGPELTGEFRAGDIRHCFADTTLARELLGFEARETLDHRLPELAEWVRRQTFNERGDEALGALRDRGLVR